MPERVSTVMYKARTSPRDASFTSPITVMKSIINLAILAVLATPALAVPQGLGVQYVDPGPRLPSVWLYWRRSQVSYLRLS